MSTPVVRLGSSEVALFASDIHMGEHDPATASWFLATLAQQAAQATHLFLLGDVFEAWVGDDQPGEVTARAIATLRAVCESGVSVFVMRGNRDFLLDCGPTGATAFSLRSGVTMLRDPAVVELFGHTVVLAHGDALCTGDKPYQQVRAEVRSPAWIERFFQQPLSDRLAFAREMRQRSQREHLRGPAADVDVHAVAALLRAEQASTLVHGHTHLPARHALRIDGADAVRWVLPDWDVATCRGGFLRADATGIGQVAAPPPASVSLHA